MKNGDERKTPCKGWGVEFEFVAFIGSGVVVAVIAGVWLGMFLIVY